MSSTKQARHFGAIRKLPSGRYQASYLLPDGKRQPAPHTFAKKRDAEAWLATVEADRLRGTLRQPRQDKRSLAAYADMWISNRPKPLAPNTVENYQRLLRNLILPQLGSLSVMDIDPETIRRWYTWAGKHATAVMRANAYKLLCAMFNTMVADKVRDYTPCTVVGGTKVVSAPREAMSNNDILALADHIYPRYRALVLTAWLAGLRIGELLGLRRNDIDLEAGTITVSEQLQKVDGEWTYTATKTGAGRRTNHIPAVLVDELTKHLATYTGTDGDSPVFTSSTGAHPSRNHIRSCLRTAAERAGVSADVFPHLLRHSGLTLVGESGATNAELLAFGGHSSMQVAMRYQHSRTDRMRELAQRINDTLSLAV